MRLEYDYSFLLDFNSLVDSHQFALMTKPRSDRQSISGFRHNLRSCDSVVDGFGNEIIYGVIEEPHNSFYFASSGFVDSTEQSGLGAIHSEVFLQSTKLVPFCAELSKYDKKLKLKGKSSYEKASYVCSFIFDHFTYERGHTHAHSDIRDVIMHEKGVCQDFAHLMLSIMRLEGIPSRYVSGLADGEGESHAWLESFIDGEWVGFDPTHDCVTKDKPYIAFSIGRDYLDCSPNRGVFRGSSYAQMLTVKSKVIRLD